MIVKFHPKETCELICEDLRCTCANPVLYHEQNVDGWDVEVFTFHYDENLAIGLGHTFWPKSSWLGFHKEDVEFVAIYTKEDSKKVYFSAHSQEGKFYKYEDCLFENGHLVVYVALNSHACYPYPKRYWRLCGLANDVCSDGGDQFEVKSLVFNQTRRKTLPKP